MSKKPHVLLVEDEASIRIPLENVLVYQGYSVESVDNGTDALERALAVPFDLILLDVMLPGMSGLEMLERFRDRNKEAPVIMLTAKADESDILAGLSLGADDYVGKPFSLAELLLRIKAVLKRTYIDTSAERPLQLDANLLIDFPNLKVRTGRQEFPITRQEARVLLYLSQHMDRAVSREELLEKVWGYRSNALIETRTVDIHIARLRRKLENNPKKPQYLVTARGAGYRLNVHS